jgi:hypothetical protein
LTELILTAVNHLNKHDRDSAGALSVKMVESNLENASGILDKVQAVAKKSAEFAANVGEFALKYGPLARRR